MTEIGIGLLAVIAGSAVLFLATFRELAPAGGLTGRGKWLLAGGLGSGIFAFAAKLALIGLFSAMSAEAIRPAASPLVAAEESFTPTSPSDTQREFASRYVWQALPRVVPAPPENPPNPFKVLLGERLFLDKNLSLDRQVACASCHDLFKGAGADGRRTSIGIDGKTGSRNAPTVWNAAFQARLFWDGRAASLEAQAVGPLVNAAEMGMPSLAAVVARVEEVDEYRSAFRAAFNDDSPITIERIAAAIATYERTLITPDTAYDRFVRGDSIALSDQAKRGMALFESVGCVQCHSGPNFSGASVFADGAPFRIFPVSTALLDPDLKLTEDPGLAAPNSGNGAWRIPSLRNVALTAPYFHNGSVDRLEDAVRIMAQTELGMHLESERRLDPAVIWSPVENTLRTIAPRTLSEREVMDISAFLRSLSSDALLPRGRGV